MNTNNKTDLEVKKEYAEHYFNEFLRRIDLIDSANPLNPEALQYWKQVKDLDFIKPEIREK
jgi:hypothetical protein